jgi:hypothetical protein
MGSPSSWLQKSQRNQIFEAIQATGLDPKEFDLTDEDGKIQIKHKGSPSLFAVGGPGRYVGSCVAGDGPAWPFEQYSWQSLISRFTRWVEDVKRYLEMPDLWAEVRRRAGLLGAYSDNGTGNTPFTPEEQKEIEMQLHEWADHARRTYSISTAQMRILDAKFDYIANAAGRLGRVDWRNAFVGAIFAYILSGALPPEFTRDMFFHAIRAAAQFYGLPGPPND